MAKMKQLYQTTYDQKCYNLASDFLLDHDALRSEAGRCELAQVIQEAIDDWIAEQRDHLNTLKRF